MQVYTSYYAKMKDLWWKYGLVRISTSVPTWFPVELPSLPELYPGWELVSGIRSGSLSQEEYTKKYLEHLSHLDREAIWEKLVQMSDAYERTKMVLLCYEAPNKFCRRHLVAEWLGNVTEW